MALLLVGLIALTPAAPLLPLLFWTRWLRRRTAAPRFATRISYALLVVGALVTLFGVVSTFRTVALNVADEVDGTSQKARMLAEGISEAINCGALAIVVALVAAFWLLFATWRWLWLARRR